MQSRARRVHAALEDPPRTAGDVARRAFDGANALACAASLTELDLIMQPAMEAIGFNHFVAVETLGPQTRLIAGHRHPTWWPHMFQHNYHMEDAPFIVARRDGGARFYSEAIHPENLTPLQQRIANERRAFGINDGFINTTHFIEGPALTVAVVGADVDARDPDVRAAALILTSYYGVAARGFHNAPPMRPRTLLTARQLDCLRWVRAGKSGADIADILGISVHTVHEHVAQACARLGVRTRVQAVVVAMSLGLIDT